MATASSSYHVVYCLDVDSDQYFLIGSNPHVNSRGIQRKCGLQRLQHSQTHTAYQVATSSPKHSCYVHKIAATPMLANDGVTIIGSCFMLLGTREVCERFIQSDPLFVKKVWKSVSITKFDPNCAKTSAVAPSQPGRSGLTPCRPVAHSA